MLKQKSTLHDRVVKKALKIRFAFSIVLSILFAGNTFAQNLNTKISKNKEISTTTLSKSEARDLSKLKSGNESESPLDAVKGKKEDVSKRDAFSKHYINEDGSFTALIGAGPIHYEKNGVWLDIDTKIQQTSFGDYRYFNKENSMESHFGNTAHKGIVSKTKEGEVTEFLDGKMYWEVNGQKLGEVHAADVAAEVEGDKLFYTNLFGNISAEFSVKTGQRKLNYIIPDKTSLGIIPSDADYLVFSERLRLPNNFRIVDGIQKYNKLTKKNQTIPGIFVIDGNDNVIYEYSAPAIVEGYNSYVMGLPTQTSPEISFEKDGDFVTFYTKVKATWIADESRTYPIAVDPTITAYPFSATSSSGQCFPTGGGDGDIYAGYDGGWYRGWVTFNMTSLPSLSNVTAATMSIYVGAKVGTMGTGSTNNIYAGHTSFDLSDSYWLPFYDDVYNAITDPSNALGAYSYIPSVSTTSYTDINIGITTALDEIERKSGNDMAFFSVSFSPSWVTGTTSRLYGIFGSTDATRKPYMSITYTAVDKYQHAAYQYANAGAIGDVGYIQIGNVSIGTINNTSTITNNAGAASIIYKNTPTGYNKYNLSTNVNVGNTYALNVRYRDLGSPFNSGKIAVWVDWNEDGDFADANEYIGISTNTLSGNEVKSYSVTVPTGTTSGTKRLRVRSFLSGDVTDLSSYNATFEYGETEDYNIVVVSPLPVKLTNFSATCEKGVILNWTTASEQNSDRFVVEKSRDAQTWNLVTEQVAAGNSNKTLNYKFIDANSRNATSYYRLRQVDVNGAEEVYGPISVSCEGNESSMTVYPNPNSGSFTIEISSTEIYNNAKLFLTDLTGKVISSQNVNIANGTTQILINDLDLKMGTYLVTLRGADQQLKPVKVMVTK